LDAENRKKALVYLGILRVLGFFRDDYLYNLALPSPIKEEGKTTTPCVHSIWR
jgi:hypothetical protein